MKYILKLLFFIFPVVCLSNDTIPFKDLVIKYKVVKDDSIPIYYYQNTKFTGMTIDSISFLDHVLCEFKKGIFRRQTIYRTTENSTYKLSETNYLSRVPLKSYDRYNYWINGEITDIEKVRDYLIIYTSHRPVLSTGVLGTRTEIFYYNIIYTRFDTIRSDTTEHITILTYKYRPIKKKIISNYGQESNKIYICSATEYFYKNKANESKILSKKKSAKYNRRYGENRYEKMNHKKKCKIKKE